MQSVPEPSLAERARALVLRGRMGVLSTLSRTPPGWPFGSPMPYVPDDRGRPLLLISRLAVHTRNLIADRRASLLVTEPHSEGDPLAAARVSLLGGVLPLPAGEIGDARALYLARHQNAVRWLDFGDFAFYRLEPAEIYYVGGFGVMGWIRAEEYAGVSADPRSSSQRP